MKMVRVQYGPDEGYFAAVLAVSDLASDAFILQKAGEAVRKECGLGEDDLTEAGTPVITDVTDEVVVYTEVKQ